MSDDTTARQLVVFSLGEEEYALPISYVHEIIRYTQPRSVASEDPSVRGVISLRGKILPVFDLATRLGLKAPERDGDLGKIVIVETATELAGIVVDAVEEVMTVEAEQIDAAPTAGSLIEGIARVEDRLIVLLSPEGTVEFADSELLAAASRPTADAVAVAA